MLLFPRVIPWYRYSVLVGVGRTTSMSVCDLRESGPARMGYLHRH